MKTIDDIARHANVSRSTVSKVINNYRGVSPTTRKRVLETIKELNYFPNATARSLITNQSKIIGLFIASKLNDPFFREVIDGIEQTLGPLGYDIVYLYTPAYSVSGELMGYVEKVRTRHVDGVVFLGFLKDVISDFAGVLQAGIPSVYLDIDIVARHSSYVMSDNKQSGKAAVEYLYKLGHRKIALIDGTHLSQPAQDRFIGFQEALNSNGLPFNPQWFFQGGFDVEDGYKAMQSLLKQRERPTAIAAQDSMAIGAMQALRDAGLSVPDDISMIGFDDMEHSKYFDLTTIRQHKAEMGQAASELLLKIINKEAFSPMVLPTSLIERGSCRPLKLKQSTAK